MKELQALTKEPAEDITLYPKSDDDLLHWVGFITGAPATPFEGGTFELDIRVPENYPLQPPTVRFQTHIFHPNIHFKVCCCGGGGGDGGEEEGGGHVLTAWIKTGEICLDVLKTAWSAVYTLQSICRSIIALLAHPEPDSPLNCDCGM
jgi:peroxin-4